MQNPTCDAIVIRAPRYINALTAPHLVMDLEAKIAKRGKVILDLGQTQKIEPENVEVILQGLMLARQRNAQFSLRAVQPQVRLILEVGGILQYFRRT